MISPQLWTLIRNISNPLSAGLDAVNGTENPVDKIALLEELLRRFGNQGTTGIAQKIVDVASKFYSAHPAEVPRLLSRLALQHNIAADWLRAALLETSGAHGEAADWLASMADFGAQSDRATLLFSYARNLHMAGRAREAWAPLQEAIRGAASYQLLTSSDKLLRRLAQNEQVPARRQCRIALLGSVTLDFWVPALHAACFGFGIDAQIYCGKFQQYQQEILAPESPLADFQPDVVILATDWRSLGLPQEAEDSDHEVEERIALLSVLWEACHSRFKATILQHTFEVPEIDAYGTLSGVLPGGRRNLLRRINLELCRAAKHANVTIVDTEQIASVYGKARWNDPVLWLAAKQYPAAEGLLALTRHQAALLRASFGLNPKCLVLDLDGLLWGGIVGEDGIEGIRLGGSAEGEAYVDFQRYLQSLRRRGLLLAVCSKNNEEDAKTVFRQHPEMVLKLDDISVFAANWEPKDANLRRIANTLNLGLDSLVFLDDSPIERSLVRRLLPEVEVLELPSDPALYVEALNRSLCFETASLTEEDRHRAAAYKNDASRHELRAASANLNDFLANLQMRVHLRPWDEANLPRIAQLINKTNQFNLTTRRMSVSEASALIDKPDCYTQYMRVSDRFGDNGLTGVLVAFEEGECLRIDNWLLSCRVLGRHIEDAMLSAAIAYARSRNLGYVLGEYVPTAKNSQVSGLYIRFGFESLNGGKPGRSAFRYRLDRGVLELPDWLYVQDETQRQGNMVTASGGE